MKRSLIRIAAALAVVVSTAAALPQTSLAEKKSPTPAQQQALKDFAEDQCNADGGTWHETESTYSCEFSDGDWTGGWVCVENTGECETFEDPSGAAGSASLRLSVVRAHVAQTLGKIKGLRTALVQITQPAPTQPARSR